MPAKNERTILYAGIFLLYTVINPLLLLPWDGDHLWLEERCTTSLEYHIHGKDIVKTSKVTPRSFSKDFSRKPSVPLTLDTMTMLIMIAKKTIL